MKNEETVYRLKDDEPQTGDTRSAGSRLIQGLVVIVVFVGMAIIDLVVTPGLLIAPAYLVLTRTQPPAQWLFFPLLLPILAYALGYIFSRYEVEGPFGPAERFMFNRYGPGRDDG